MPTVTLDDEPYAALVALIERAPALCALAENAETLVSFASLARDEIPDPVPDTNTEAAPVLAEVTQLPAPSSTARARI